MEGSYDGDSGSKTKIVYGVFTTPENAIGGNAICAFQISDVLDTFEGPFKEQETHSILARMTRGLPPKYAGTALSIIL